MKKAQRFYRAKHKNKSGQSYPGQKFLAFHLYQTGVENVVVLVGLIMSEQQEELIVKALGLDGKAVLLFDSNVEGQNVASSLFRPTRQLIDVKR